MIGGFGVGAALIIAPMYIAELAPPHLRGRMVSLAQLNIVVGISAAFFSNYLILLLGQSDLPWAAVLNLDEWGWRWMLGIETLPAVVYFIALLAVPESPRWLVMQGRDDDSLDVMARVRGREQAVEDLAAVKDAIRAEKKLGDARLGALFHPTMRLVLAIGITIGILQQITGINAVFFYAPMIFEQSGIGTNAAFMQAVLVGLTNLAFTVVAILYIDRLGRRRLLGVGVTGIAVCMFLLAWGFGNATYSLDQEAIDGLPAEIDRTQIEPLRDVVYHSDVAFRDAAFAAIGEGVYTRNQSAIVTHAIDINPTLILVAIMGFVGSFAMSLGPIMWVLFSELFPNRVRGIAVSFVGFINSATAFFVTFIFPWELSTIGNAWTFLIYGLFAVVGLVLIMRILPETKGRSLEELEVMLTRE